MCIDKCIVMCIDSRTICLALMYRYGGLQVRWFRRAAERGHMQAQYLLAHCLQHGRGVRSDEQEAMQWYMHAAEQGHAASQVTMIEFKYLGSYNGIVGQGLIMESLGAR